MDARTDEAFAQAIEDRYAAFVINPRWPRRAPGRSC
jgi:hypothetical protein